MPARCPKTCQWENRAMMAKTFWHQHEHISHHPWNIWVCQNTTKDKGGGKWNKGSKMWNVSNGELLKLQMNCAYLDCLGCSDRIIFPCELLEGRCGIIRIASNSFHLSPTSSTGNIRTCDVFASNSLGWTNRQTPTSLGEDRWGSMVGVTLRSESFPSSWPVRRKWNLFAPWGWQGNLKQTVPKRPPPHKFLRTWPQRGCAFPFIHQNFQPFGVAVEEYNWSVEGLYAATDLKQKRRAWELNKVPV